MKKKRGAFLTIMIVLGAFGALQALYAVINTDALKLAYGQVPAWFSPLYLFSFLLSVGAIIGIWMWKKWGVYLIAASIALNLVTQLFLFKPVQQSVGQFSWIMTLVGGGLWFWAISRKWPDFE